MLTNKDGSPLQNLEFQLLKTDGTLFTKAKTNSKGEFRTKLLKGQSFIVLFEKESNEVLVTSFTTHGTPLIRYRIGDALIFDHTQNSCECGMESPIV